MSRLPSALCPKRAPCAVAATLLLASASLRAAPADSIELRRSDSERAPPSPVWLRLRGGYARSGEPRERVFGVLELGLALDVLVAGRASVLAAGDSRGAERAGSRREAQEIAASDDAEAAGAAAPPPRASAPFRPAPLPRSLELSSALARATLAAANHVADAAASPAALDSMLARTHSSASLPEVRLAAGTSRDQSQRLAPTVTDPAKFTQDGGRDLWFEARLTWHLEQVLFSHDEIAIERLKAQALESRRQLVRQVLEALPAGSGRARPRARRRSRRRNGTPRSSASWLPC